MAKIKPFQSNGQFQNISQRQKLSQYQIQALNFLSMTSEDLRDEILKMEREGLIDIVFDPFINSGDTKSNVDFSLIENTATSSGETLQKHLIDQLKLQNISEDQYDLCYKLIFNLDKDGFYGSKMRPETLIDINRPGQNLSSLNKCISLIQHLDPIGTCCKDVFESLKVQAEILGGASVLTKFVLNGNLQFLQEGSPEKILKKMQEFKKEWHSKAFANPLPIDDIVITQQMILETLDYIRNLSPYPAANYDYDNSGYNKNYIDVVLKVKKMEGEIQSDDFSLGRVKINEKEYYQVLYASDILPEIQVSKIILNKEDEQRAQTFIENLNFVKNSYILQGCAIVKYQWQFFNKGPGNLEPLTKKELAQKIGIHESTVSRFSSKKYGKYIETSWGVFPVSYFFTSSVKSSDGNKISSEVIKQKINEIVGNSNEKLSDSKLTQILNSQGIAIARRTVAKYREQLGIDNSYHRN